MSGPRSSASGDTDFTAHRIATSRRACKEIVAAKRRKIISCHLGGSCSICAIENGKSVANSFGMTAQIGRAAQQSRRRFRHVRTAEADQADAAGRHLQKAQQGRRHAGHERRVARHARHRNCRRQGEESPRAKLAIDAFVESVRAFIGSYLVALGGCDVLVFTGGIGENGVAIREAICHNLEWAGIVLDHNKEPGPRPGRENQQRRIEHGNLDRADERRIDRRTADSVGSS